MTPLELADRLRHAIAVLDELADEMDDSSRACGECGLVVRKNMDDYQGKQAFEAASNRVVKMYEKLVVGTWQGRSLVPVVDASEVRKEGKQ